MPAEGFVMPAKGFVMLAKGMTKCPPRALPNPLTIWGLLE